MHVYCNTVAFDTLVTLVLFAVYMVLGVVMYTLVFEEQKGCESAAAIAAHAEATFALGARTGATPDECTEPWTWVDALYFSMATMSTVGYGDFSPGSDASQGFTLGFIFIGIGVVFASIANLMSDTTKPLFKRARALMDTCCPPKQIDITGNGIADFKYPRHPLIYYTKNLLPLTLFVLVLQLSSAAVFVALIPDLRYGTAVYHCFVTATTVGYGDVGVSTQEARGFACVHMLLSVAMVGVLISDIDDVRAARRASFKQLNLLKKKLDRELILSLDQDGGGVDKMEFVVGMLTRLDLVAWEDVEPFIKQFEALDTSGDGTLSSADLASFANAQQKFNVSESSVGRPRSRSSSPGSGKARWQSSRRVSPACGAPGDVAAAAAYALGSSPPNGHAPAKPRPIAPAPTRAVKPEPACGYSPAPASLAAVAAAAAATPTRLPSLPAATLIPAPPLAALPPTFTDRTYGGGAVPPATAPLPPLRKGPLPSVLGKPQQSPGWPAASVPKVSYYY